MSSAQNPKNQGGGAKAQVARLLTLVPLLHAHGEMPLAAAAEALGVSPEQLLRDLRVLFMVGRPGGLPDDLIEVDVASIMGPDEKPIPGGMIRISNAEYLARPLRLSPTEASAMIVALRALRHGAATETREVVDRALAKLETAAAAGPARLDPGPEPASTETLALAERLRDAVDRRRQVRLRYYVPARDEVSERIVDPRGVLTAGDALYLDAWCHSAEAPRLFRLDRVAEAEVLESPVETPAEGPRDLSEGFFTRSDESTRVKLRLDPEAAWVTEYYPVEKATPGQGGVIEVEMLIADPRWLRRLVLRLAPHAQVLAPQEVADDVAAAVQAALELYS